MSEKAERRQPGTTKADPNVQRFLAAYTERFQAKSAGDPPLIYWARDGRQAKALLSRYPFERLIALLERFFSLDDDWVRQRGYSLAAFQSALNQLLMDTGAARQSRPICRHTGWSRAIGGDVRTNPVTKAL